MKSNCNIVKDLLPLYIDDVCSEESKKLVEEHLKECKECQRELEKLTMRVDTSTENEVKVFKNFAKRINFKIIRRVAICTSILFILGVGTLKFCNTYKINMEYDDRMDILLLGNEKKWNFQFFSPKSGPSFGKVIKTQENGENVNLIFIDLKLTLRNYYRGEGAGGVPELDYDNTNFNDKMRVYYTTEDLNVIENASSEELTNIIKESKLIFTNDKVKANVNCTLNNQNYNYTLTYYEGNRQIIDSEGDTNMPDELLMDTYGPQGKFKSLWFTGNKVNKIFDKTQKYFTSKGGTCTIESDE